MIVTAHTPEDFAVFREFFERVDGGTLKWDLRMLGQMDVDQRLQGVVWFNNFVERTCFVHATGKLTPGLLRASFNYVFADKIVQIYGPMSADNHKLVALTRWMGFDELHRVKGGWDGKTDLVMMTMHKSQCRWLRKPDQLRAAA